MGKSQFDEPMTFAKWWAIRSSALLELKLTPAQWYEKFAGQNIDSGGTPQLMLDTSGRITEANSANIYDYTSDIRLRLITGLPLTALATGSTAAGIVWVPILPVTVTADGAGNPPATEIVAATIGKQKDIMLWWTVDTVSGANQYQHNFREATASPAVVTPDWTAITIPAAANETQPGHTYGARMATVNDNTNFGIADGANGDWPNGAKVTFWGFYRNF